MSSDCRLLVISEYIRVGVRGFDLEVRHADGYRVDRRDLEPDDRLHQALFGL